MGKPGKKPGSVYSWQNDSGTTLLEVVAALGIMVLLLGVLAQLLHTGGRLWLKSDRAYQMPHQLQDLQNLLGQDLRQAYTSDFLPGQALSGDATQLVLWRETPRGLEQVTYRYDAVAKTLYRSAGFWGERCEEEAAFTDLAAWKFEYYAAAAKRWQYSWEPERKITLPTLIEITAATPEHDLGSQVIAVEAGHDEADD